MNNKREVNLRYYRTPKGILTSIYAGQKQSSVKRGHSLPEYSKNELKEWLFNHSDFNRLFDEWIKNDFNKDFVPSIDRLDDYKPYTLNNIRLVSFRDNYLKSHSDVTDGINNKKSKAVEQYKDGVLIEVFYSVNSASRITRVNATHISSCCLGKRKSAGKFKWKHKN